MFLTGADACVLLSFLLVGFVAGVAVGHSAGWRSGLRSRLESEGFRLIDGGRSGEDDDGG